MFRNFERTQNDAPIAQPRGGRRHLAVATAMCALLSAIMITTLSSPASAMRRVRVQYPGNGAAPGMEAAVRSAFPPKLHRAALDVAWCESRGRASARNGQYKGHFQIGRREWAKFGKGGNPYNAHHNAAAAYRYYRVAGWGPWECRP